MELDHKGKKEGKRHLNCRKENGGKKGERVRERETLRRERLKFLCLIKERRDKQRVSNGAFLEEREGDGIQDQVQ